MLSVVAKLAKVAKGVIVDKYEYQPKPQEGKGSAQPQSKMTTIPTSSQGKILLFHLRMKKVSEKKNISMKRSKEVGSYDENTSPRGDQHPFQRWKTLIGTSWPLVKKIDYKESGKGKAIQVIKRVPEVGLLDITKDSTRIQPYPSKQDDIFFDAADVFLEKSVARFRESTFQVCFPLGIGFIIWWTALPEFVIEQVPESCLDHKWIKIWIKVMGISTVLEKGEPDENGTIGGIPLTDLVNSESKEYLERITFDPLDINKGLNRKHTIAVLFVAFLALTLGCEEALKIPVEDLMI
ncbi:unnamed protein product [Ilex paraguariensis]|uniref:Uncharacterized protein n=1 Tax=Ilex paraguariensis TaxID=185542 RepID=A0ABC8S955_9AQUA